MLLKRGLKGQVTIFIVVGILLVALAVLIFVFFQKSSPVKSEVPKEFQPIYNDFLSCLEEQVSFGISLMESKGGRIYEETFEPGSSYMPFSNVLDFLGNKIPYWYYVSGNNLEREKVPSKLEMQNQLALFLEESVSRCSFEKYYPQGFSVYTYSPKASVKILDKSVELDLRMPMSITFGEDSNFISNSHEVSVKSNLGSLYDAAVKIYNYEQNSLFLEEYTLDVLRLYAPVDGVELSCSPKTWNADEVFEEFSSALEGNLYALRNKEGNYELNDKRNKYFVLDFDVPYDVRFLTSRNWSKTYEVVPSTGNLLIATPVGNQAGLGIMGFCYTPYHFVYDIKYPVLVQVSHGDEIFQFPFAVVVSGNNPRESLVGEYIEQPSSQVCDSKNTPMNVVAYDMNADPIVADISFQCAGVSCDIGSIKSRSGFVENFPQCVNGVLVAKSEGFVSAKRIVSTVNPGTLEIFLNKLYELDVNLKLNGAEYSGDAMILFNSPDHSAAINYPHTKEISLSSGEYEVRVYIYRNSSIKIPSSVNEQCIDSPKSGLSGLFGLTEEKCFEIEVPSQIVSNALHGGGVQNYYILESEISGATTLEIGATSLPAPTSLEKLQENYLLFEDNRMDITFK